MRPGSAPTQQRGRRRTDAIGVLAPSALSSSVRRAGLAPAVRLGVLALVLSVAPPLWGQPLLPAWTDVAAVMTRVNDYWLASHPNPLGNDWDPAVYHVGNLEAWRVTGNPAYYRYALAWAEYHQWRTYAYLPWPPSTNADHQCCGQVYAALYQLESVPLAAHLAPTLASIDRQVNRPAVDDWWWIDALFMSAPVFARCGVLLAEPSYGSKLNALYLYPRDTLGLYDAASGLWYRDAWYVYPARTTSNGQKVFWARGNGWVAAAMARVLEALPDDDPHGAEYAAMLQTMAATLKALLPLHAETSYGDDGFWRASLHDPAEFPNPETTGTAAFVYALAWGVNHGVLDESYLSTILKAWNGLVTAAVQPSGRLGWCQSRNSRPAATTADQTNDFGVGLFLLAASEVARLAGPIPPAVYAVAGTDQAVHDDYADGVEDVVLDGSASYGHGADITGYEWRLDDVVVGTGAVVTVPIPRGEHLATLTVTDGAAATSSDSVRLTVADYPVAPVAAVTASADDGNAPANAVDGNLATRWSASGAGQWLQLDLGSPVQFASVGIAFYSGTSRIAYFDLSASMDTVQWAALATGLQSSGATLDLETFATPVTEARYVRVTGHGNSVNAWNSITEVAVYTGPIPHREAQQIEFAALPVVTYGDAPLDLSAAASSGLPIEFSLDQPGVVALAGNTLTILGAGTVTITATQAGDDDWLPATPVARTLTVLPRVLTVTADDRTRLIGEPNPAFSLRYGGFAPGDDLTDLDTPPAAVCAAAADSPPGRYPIEPSGAADPNYSFQYIPGTLTIFAAVHTATYLAGLHGSISGPTPQDVPHGTATVPVTAVPEYAYVFAGWEDGSQANPRQDDQLIADLTVVATFQPAPPASRLEGTFLALAREANRSWWNLTGSYATHLAGAPLTLDLVHDTRGRLGGRATYRAENGIVLSMPVRGCVRGAAGVTTLKATLRGTSPDRRVAVAATLLGTVDPGPRELAGVIKGTTMVDGVSEAVDDHPRLTIPAPMDGTWSLVLSLANRSGAITGTASLTLAEPSRTFALAVRGRRVGHAAMLALTGDLTDPAARAIAIRSAVLPLEGGWALLQRGGARGYGQQPAW